MNKGFHTVTDRTQILVLMIISTFFLNLPFSLTFYDTAACETACLQTCFEQLFCQPKAHFSVTELTARPLPLPVSHILNPWSCSNLSLTKLNIKPSSPTHSHFLPLCFLVKKIPQSTLLFPPSFLPSKFRSFLSILSRCQGHPLCYLASARFLPQVCVTSHWDFCPVCLSGQVCLVMDTCQILLLRLCFLFAGVNSDFITLLSRPFPWHAFSSSPFTTTSNFVIFKHLSNSAHSFHPLLRFVLILSSLCHHC